MSPSSPSSPRLPSLPIPPLYPPKMRFFAAKIFFFKKNLHILRKSSTFAAIMRSCVLA